MSIGRQLNQKVDLVKKFLNSKYGLLLKWSLTFLLVVVSLVVSSRSLGAIEGFSLWGYLYIIGVLIPSGFSIIGLQFSLACKALNVKVDFAESLRVASAATIANLLPIPGALFVRISSLKKKGIPIKRATAVTAAVSLVVLSMSLTISGFILVGISHLYGAVALMLGLAVGILSLYILSHNVDESIKVLWKLCLLAMYISLISGMNLFFIMMALGRHISLSSAVVISASGVLASALGIFPGGLGARELIAGGLSLIFGFDAGIIVTAVLITRVAESLGLLILQIGFRASKVSRR